MRVHRKPTGQIGTIRVPGGDEPFKPVVFPPDKSAVEDFILSLAVKNFRDRPGCPWKETPQRNPEDDFDFTIRTSPPEYLDALEVAPLEGPYTSASLSYNHGEIADHVWNELNDKARGYGRSADRCVHILLYSTDLAFRLGQSVVDILSCFCSRTDLGFSSIVYVVPDDQQNAEVFMVWPRPPQALAGFSLASARQRRSLVGNATKAVAFGEGAVSVALGGSPARPK